MIALTPRALIVLVVMPVLALAALSACARGDDGPGASGIGAAADGGGSSLPEGRDAAGDEAPVDASSGADAGKGTDAGVDDAAADSGAGLDPDLEVPGAGAACNTPGSPSGCPSLTVCRIAGPNAGRCEGCTTCGNLGAPCTASDQCDTLFQCFQGKCTNLCPLGTSYCGAVADCLDVGHATHGVCKP